VKAFFSSNCRVCTIVRIHVVLVLGVLAAWRLRPEWFTLAKDVPVQHWVAIGVLAAVLTIFLVKTFEHYRQSRTKHPDRR
jgi:membrane protein YdbS with pleckstrin-like domain